jgi:hypothetical protein
MRDPLLNSHARVRRYALLGIFMLAGIYACSKHADQPAPAVSPTPAAQNSSPAALPSGGSNDEMFDAKRYPNAVTGVALDPQKLTPSERKYGVAPKRDPAVTYAPDVIVMEQGDQAIQGYGTDGVTWSFDASSPHVSEFQEGKIIFATGRAVGRIGQLTRSGGTVTVKLAPVQINEVIQDGHFIIDSDVDSAKALVYEAPDFPSVIDFKAAAAQPTIWDSWKDGQLFKAQLPSGLGSIQMPSLTPMVPPVGQEAMSLSGGALTTFPLHGSDSSVGVGFGYHKSGLNMEASGSIVLKDAHMKFALDIQHFKILTAGMNLGGASSLKVRLQAWSNEKEVTVNAYQIVELPSDVSISIPVGGVPLSLTFHTSFVFNSGFSAKQSVLTAEGEYTVDGDIFIGVRDGVPQIIPFAHTSAKTSLASSVQGVSVGINSLALSFKVEPMVGIGAFGFNTGVYVGLSFGGSVVKQSSVALSQCRGGYMNGVLNGGVGYQLPAKFVAVINGILSVFTKYRITGTGHLFEVPDYQFMKLDEDIPTGCASQGQKA